MSEMNQPYITDGGDLFGQAEGAAAFDFNREYMSVVRDVARACEEFGHIDADRIAVSYSMAKTSAKHGLQAKIYPLRFEGGAREKSSKGYKFTIPPVFYDGVEIFYIISFCIPRFLNLSISEKLETIIHELFHISPRFNGDIRRLSMGSKAAHGSSHEIFDRFVAKIVKRYLYSGSRSLLPKFLYMDYKKLKQAYAEIRLEKLKIPKIITEKE
jgi:predicted metallopeptidase